MTINGVELELDIMNAEDAGKYEAAMTIIRDRANKGVETNLQKEILRQCEIVRNAMDTIWGEGTGQKVFGDKYNLKEHLEVVEMLNDTSDAQTNELNKYAQALNRKYGNRSQRRNKK